MEFDENVNYQVDLAGDIRDLVTITYVSEELKLRSNGGLIWCLDFFWIILNDLKKN